MKLNKLTYGLQAHRYAKSIHKHYDLSDIHLSQSDEHRIHLQRQDARPRGTHFNIKNNQWNSSQIIEIPMYVFRHRVISTHIFASRSVFSVWYINVAAAESRRKITTIAKPSTSEWAESERESQWINGKWNATWFYIKTSSSKYILPAYQKFLANSLLNRIFFSAFFHTIFN